MGESTSESPESNTPPSRLASLPAGARLAVTLLLLTLGLGYLSAVGSIYLSTKDADGKPEWSLMDARIHYGGHGGQSRLEVMLRGSMFKELGEDAKERQENFDTIHAWLTGADRGKETFHKQVWDVIDLQCVSCHAREPMDDQRGQPDSPLENHRDVMVFANSVDTGMSYRQLFRMTHTHLFGIGGLIAGLSLILWCTGATVRVKAWISCMGFAVTLADVASWWLIKLWGGFVYLLGLSGPLLGISLLLFILIPIHDMWGAKRAES